MKTALVWSLDEFGKRHDATIIQREAAQSLLRRLVNTWSPQHSDCGAALHIRSRTTAGKSRRPIIFLNDPETQAAWPLRLRISISHLSSATAVAISTDRVGIDLVDLRAQLRPSFVRQWFSHYEQHAADVCTPHLIWAAKESAYKALCRREPFRPGKLQVTSVVEGTSETQKVTWSLLVTDRITGREMAVRAVAESSLIIAIASNHFDELGPVMALRKRLVQRLREEEALTERRPTSARFAEKFVENLTTSLTSSNST